MSKRAEELAAEALGTVFEYDPGDPKSHVLIAKIAGIIRVYGQEVRRRDAEVCRELRKEIEAEGKATLTYNTGNRRIWCKKLDCAAAAIEREKMP